MCCGASGGQFPRESVLSIHYVESLGTELRLAHLYGKYLTTELSPQPSRIFLCILPFCLETGSHAAHTGLKVDLTV